MSDRYAVIGNPIAHSKSPLIHHAFARQTGEDIRYERILGDPERFSDDVRSFFAGGGQGMNVTVPFKEAAYRIAEHLSSAAAAAGAVNTLWLDQSGLLQGANTDGIGLVRDLASNHGFDFSARKVLLVGAGGAARGVVLPLLQQGIKKLTIANRTASKAVELARQFSEQGEVVGCGLDALQGQRFDLVINGTAAGLAGQVPGIPDDSLAPEAWTYDMMYASNPTAFVHWGRAHGAARALDGLGMLVEQAAESFYLWRGVRPLTRPVIEELRSS